MQNFTKFSYVMLDDLFNIWPAKELTECVEGHVRYKKLTVTECSFDPHKASCACLDRGTECYC